MSEDRSVDTAVSTPQEQSADLLYQLQTEIALASSAIGACEIKADNFDYAVHLNKAEAALAAVERLASQLRQRIAVDLRVADKQDQRRLGWVYQDLETEDEAARE